MIYIDTSKEKTRKIIQKWCKDNGYAYSFDVDNGRRSDVVYPFTILAPQAKKEELEALIKDIDPLYTT